MIFELDLTLAEGADPLEIADMIMTVLMFKHALPGVESINGCDPPLVPDDSRQ